MAKYSNKKLMSMVSSSNVFDRVTAAKNGCGLETLVGDPSWRVRSAVASVGYGLDVLKDDMKYQVRVAVAQQGCYLDEFSKDEHWEVRLQAFKQGVSVNYIDDKTGEYLRSFLEAPLFYLIHS